MSSFPYYILHLFFLHLLFSSSSSSLSPSFSLYFNFSLFLLAFIFSFFHTLLTLLYVLHSVFPFSLFKSILPPILFFIYFPPSSSRITFPLSFFYSHLTLYHFLISQYFPLSIHGSVFLPSFYNFFPVPVFLALHLLSICDSFPLCLI